MKMSGEGIQPLKCALRFKPPILALIYKDNATGKTRKRSMPLRNFSAETDVESYAAKLIATPRHAYYVGTIPLIQLHSLLQRVKNAQQDEGMGGPSQTTTPVQPSLNPFQSSLHDIPPLSPLSTPIESTNRDHDQVNKQFEDDITKLLDLDNDDGNSRGESVLAVGKHKSVTSAPTNPFDEFGVNPSKISTDDFEDDPFTKVLQGKMHSPLRESLKESSVLKDKNKNKDTEASTEKPSAPEETKEPDYMPSFSLSSHSDTQRTDGKLPPLKRRPLGDIPPLSPSKSPPLKSKQEDKENKQFEKGIANLLGLGDDVEPESKTKNANKRSLFDDTQDKSAAFDDGDANNDDDAFWSDALHGKAQSPVHKLITPSTRIIDSNRERQKETETITTSFTSSLGLQELPPLTKTPLSSVLPQPVGNTESAPWQNMTTEPAANEIHIPDYSEDFDSESREISHGGRKIDLPDDFADDRSLSFAIEELEEEEDGLGLNLDLGDDLNQLTESLSGEDIGNIITPSSLSAPIGTGKPTRQSSSVITGAHPRNEDLNKANDEYVSQRKQEMDVLFLANQLKPGDDGYVYDKEVEFDQGPKIESCGWDTESEMSDF